MCFQFLTKCCEWTSTVKWKKQTAKYHRKPSMVFAVLIFHPRVRLIQWNGLVAGTSMRSLLPNFAVKIYSPSTASQISIFPINFGSRHHNSSATLYTLWLHIHFWNMEHVTSDRQDVGQVVVYVLQQETAVHWIPKQHPPAHLVCLVRQPKNYKCQNITNLSMPSTEILLGSYQRSAKWF